MRLKHLCMAAVVAVMPLGAAQADRQAAAFFIEVGREDFFNSKGQPLRDVASVIRQDRANFHRFGIRHPGDESDPYFSNVGFRQAIPDLVNAGNLDGYLRGVLGRGWPGWNADYLVQLCASGGQLTRMLIDPADGDGHSSC
ncbi:MAG: hypothetical protein AAFY65_04725 [Pseudomonadota bacterium]